MTAGSEPLQLPIERTRVLDIAPEYKQLAAEEPVARVRTRTGDPAWLVTGYAEAQALFADRRVGRSHPDPANAPRLSDSAMVGGPREGYETEEQDNQRMRRLLAPAFSPRRMNALSEHIQALTDRMLDRMAGLRPPVDLHEELSFPLPILVICELLGVPFDDRDKFRAWSQAAGDLRDPVAAAQARDALSAYTFPLIGERRASPGDDVLSILVAGGDDVDDEEIANIAGGLLFAGHETTSARIDYGTLLLLAHPDQRDLLVNDPSLVPTAVEEIIRCSIFTDHGVPAYTREPVEVGSVTIDAGELVVIFPDAANRDPRVFPDPDRFDITRRPEYGHLTFGYGPHFCIGAGLARLELQAVFGRLFQRLPGLRLAVPLEEIRIAEDRFLEGIAGVPVTW
ncbi:cytochrome P450 [Actinomadura opuntiae]|uniref:cytochrome P450 n=1 Tax=Actinomadura sp. OS1-43 TaxID=604315 RepID=UPI00255B0BAB|nr:cytochrome P450 [Actinomadura sp. OS1-43]MDL4815445.1 cytochrome P450 [Actinomadura sp. OS1-43]